MSDPSNLQKIAASGSGSLLRSQDYVFLRQKGLEYIRNLSGKIWTDHNEHDPGVTTLEVLCYALADLGYRTGFDMRDLLTTKSGFLPDPALSGLFPAHKVLPTAPLTIFDYRRLLAKVKGVRNAWLFPLPGTVTGSAPPIEEMPLYADCGRGKLTFNSTPSAQAVAQGVTHNPAIQLNGLYQVLLELEVDNVLGSLNETRLVYTVKSGALKGVVVSLDSQDPAFSSGQIDFSLDFNGIQSANTPIAVGKLYRSTVTIKLLKPGNPPAAMPNLTLNQLVLRVLNDRPRPNENPVVITPADLKALLGDSVSDGLVALFWRKQQRRRASLRAARCVLMSNRNLCEDLYSLDTVQADRIAICADVELRNEADIELVQARLLHAIEQYFNPPICFYTLKELLDEGLCTDEIFNGPYVAPEFCCDGQEVDIRPGFIKDAELAASELRQEIRVSDIINLLADFPEVIAVRNVLLRRYDVTGNPIGNAEKWLMPVVPGSQPVLAVEQSKLIFYKNQVPFRARRDEFQQTLDHLRDLAQKSAYVDQNQVLETTPGRYRQPDKFFSVQHDYPRTYAIGTAGLPEEATPERVAAARQLKAYLTFYDQVLADYLAQLANLGAFFSLDKSITQTYFSQYLKGIAGVRQDFENEFFFDPSYLQDPAKRSLLNEDRDGFLERRNRTLDHLLSRFAESFTDYVLMMYDLEGDPFKTGQELIDHKIDFLREVPILSRERAKAFNYQPEDAVQVWNTDNVSGLQKRLSRLLGIDDYTRRNLACALLFSKLFSPQKIPNVDNYNVVIKSATKSVIFKSVEVFPDRDSALAKARQIFLFLRREGSYQVDSSGGVNQVLYRIKVGAHQLENARRFETEADAIENIREIIDRFDEILRTEDCNHEGFHLIEHILLRPFTAQDNLFDVCLDPDCKMCGDEDPYSFRIQVVLPYWPQRFNNIDFRRFFEHTLRLETPAHIETRVCWVSFEQMVEMDHKYHAWLQAKAKMTSGGSVNQSALTQAQNELVDLLQRLKTVYPAARLNDCVEGEEKNVLRLGSSNLGIF